MSRELFCVGGLVVSEADPAGGLDRHVAAVHEFDTAMQRERLSGDPPLPLELTRSFLANIPSFLLTRQYLARDVEGRVVAAATLNVERTDSNQHVCNLEIGVLPEHRRKGVAKALLSLVAGAAKEEKRSLILGATAGSLPSGESFARRIGARSGLRRTTHRLRMANADRNLARVWQEKGAARAEFRLERIDGRYPEVLIDEIIRLQHVVNAEPRGELEVEDQILSTSRAREVEEIWLGARGERWGFFVREGTSGRFVGWTEVVWYPSLPQIAFSIGTGVLGDFRDRGLGKWLRGALIDWLADQRPEVEEIRMDIADSNTGMRSISKRLGFEPLIDWNLWQASLVDVRRYLAS